MNSKLNTGIAAYRMAATQVHPRVAIVKLFDQMLFLLRRAITATEAKKHEESYINIVKTSMILRALIQNLRFDLAEQMSTDLMRTYNRNIVALHMAYGKPDAIARYQKIAEGLAELRDAWAIVAGMPTLK
ncbi:flagellar export chaperone FliS [Terrarubrum flagellatum]|uniref:flagellar export chaperone FliS n=1 Tax=Terrirubrum flagellatum TaxID=2895980 RepID=UPI00314505C2